MKNPVKLLIAGLSLSLSLPMAASAMSDDTTYCNALVAKYESLVANRSGGRSRTQSGLETSVALEQCKNGNPAGIHVLEQKLRDSKIELPSRN